MTECCFQGHFTFFAATGHCHRFVIFKADFLADSNKIKYDVIRPRFSSISDVCQPLHPLLQEQGWPLPYHVPQTIVGSIGSTCTHTNPYIITEDKNYQHICSCKNKVVILQTYVYFNYTFSEFTHIINQL